MIQSAIFILGALSIWLLGGGRKSQAWAIACGLGAQPFWLWTTYHGSQWGMFALALVYTVSWGRMACARWKRRG